ncbi:hypothetical protein [Neptunomonas sp.]|uniref:hypothetical protein n=1 Tax=Neptunomonas sp. TaxID=1971898 RepID=UPI003566E101
MTTIYGYVRIKETNDPIFGLVVGIFKSVSESVEDWFEQPPVSLGSTITDNSGQFKIEIGKPALNELSNQQHKFILAVLAPSTTETINAVVSQTLKKRLLHFMELPAVQSGQTEASIICLSQKQLEQFKIPTPKTKQKLRVEDAVDRLVTSYKEDQRFHQLFNEKLAPMRQDKITLRREMAAKAKKFTAKLQATPKNARNQPCFIHRNDPQYEEKLAAAKLNAMETSLDCIKKNEEERSKRNPIHLTLTASHADLEKAGISIDLIETGEAIDQEQLCSLLNAKRGGTELVRASNLLEDYHIRKESDGRIRNAFSPTEEELPDDESGSSESPDLDRLDTTINQQVHGQLSDMPLPNGSALPMKRLFIQDGTLVWGNAATSEGEEDGTYKPAQDFSKGLGQSPANVPAFHDFHQLQIAFKHVWTEAFDSQVKEDIEKLYEAYNELHEEFGFEFISPSEIEETQNIQDFLQEIEGTERIVIAETITARVLALISRLGLDSIDWFYLSAQQRNTINYMFARGSDASESERLWYLDGTLWVGHEALQTVKKIFDNPQGVLSRLQRLRLEIAARLSEPYAFHYFAPNSTNFGLMTTYRQLWEPQQYQVGDLVATIPLAPGEKRKFSTKQNIKRTRAEKELDKALSSRSSESTITQRADVEIVNKASMQSNFKVNAEGVYRFGIGEIRASTDFTLDQSQESSSVKKNFREAVLKAAQEYKQERSLEVTTTDELTTKTTTSGELSNPNNEISVTYMLWELERQYRVSERIHRVTPVIMVAQDVPAPHEITESWLLTHDWILRRVLLDDSLQVALNYLTNAFAGEEFGVAIYKANWDMQKRIIEKKEVMFADLLSSRKELQRSYLGTRGVLGGTEAAESAQNWFTEAMENIFSEDERDRDINELKKELEIIQEQLSFLEEQVSEGHEELSFLKETFDKITSEYITALEAQTNRRVAIDQLRIHIKQNILFYMQAIWDHEPPDQRFFRLYQVEVDLPESTTRTCRLRRATDEDIAAGLPTLERSGDRYILYGCEAPSLPAPGTNTKSLVEIADLDNPLGYKGNYIIFPLKTCLYLTNFMMRELFDDYFGVRDPDLLANFSTEELLEYTEAFLKDLNDPASALNDRESELHVSDSERERMREALRTLVLNKLQQPRRDSDLVIVPTGELFMEALLGKQALLEDFKMIHRGYDVVKARAELREIELENLRKAARLLQEEPNLEDPDVDKRIVVEGGSDIHIDTPE